MYRKKDENKKRQKAFKNLSNGLKIIHLLLISHICLFDVVDFYFSNINVSYIYWQIIFCALKSSETNYL